MNFTIVPVRNFVHNSILIDFNNQVGIKDWLHLHVWYTGARLQEHKPMNYHWRYKKSTTLKRSLLVTVVSARGTTCDAYYCLSEETCWQKSTLNPQILTRCLTSDGEEGWGSRLNTSLFLYLIFNSRIEISRVELGNPLDFKFDYFKALHPELKFLMENFDILL